MPKASMYKIAKKRKRTSHKPNKFKMTGKLALQNKKDQDEIKTRRPYSHHSLEELIKAVGPLHELECDANKEQLL
jgi:hypothetical protein